MKKIYLSAPVSEVLSVRSMAKFLKEVGDAEIVSTWHNEGVNLGYSQTDIELGVASSRDWRELKHADTLITMTHGISPTGGMHVEFGLALAENLDIIIIGPKRNVFHYYDSHMIHHYPTMMDFRISQGEVVK